MIRQLDGAPLRFRGLQRQHGWLLWRRRRAELIELCARRFRYQPQRFRWRGLLHTVRHVDRVWEHVGKRSGRARRYFRVTCHDDKTYTLFQDLRLGAWYVEL